MTTPLIPQADFNEITQLIHAAQQSASAFLPAILAAIIDRHAEHNFSITTSKEVRND